MKYIKNEIPKANILNQSEISDELAELWIKNRNTNISDVPWPNLEIVPSFIVDDGPIK